MTANDIQRPGRLAVVVNDDPVQLMVVSEFLRGAGLEPRAFGGAEAALAAMLSWSTPTAGDPVAPPDLIVTDLHMPGLDGWRFCRLLRSPEYAAFNGTPILVVSATFAGEEPSRITSDLGANAFLPVPVSMERFQETVHALLDGGPSRERVRALIVEDSKALAGLLKRDFDAEGYETDTVTTVAAATAAFSSVAYDVAVLDYHLPDGVGDTLLSLFHARRPDCVCVMMTADPSPELALDWMKKGAVAYARKPFKPAFLLELCARARRERSLLRVEDMLEARTRQLKENEERYRTILQTAMDGFWRVDSHGRLLEVNEAYCRMSGYSAVELLAMNVAELEANDPAADAVVGFQTARAERRQRSESRHRRKDGAVFDVEISLQFQPLDAGSSVVFLRDITEQKRADAERHKLEAQLRQSHKLQAIGTLAGGIAHDFNNILASIVGHTELLAQDLQADHRSIGFLAEIQKASRRATDLVRQILAFSRPSVRRQRILDLRGTVQEAGQLLRATLPAGVELVTRSASRPALILADAVEIHRILVNLVTNGWQAMAGQPGRITLSLEAVTIDEAFARTHADLRAGGYVRLTVSDTGQGIDPAALERIFDPFFTTKDVGEGTGLGLSVVHGIVKNCRGAILVNSRPGQGTDFEIYFPAASEEVPSEALPSVPGGIAATPNLRILLLDDETAVAAVAKRLLERHGYRISAFTEVADALAGFRCEPDAFDLIITDYNMPGCSGLQVAREIRELRPQLPVLMTSGFLTDELRIEAQAAGVASLCGKPFQTQELLEAINRCVGVAGQVTNQPPAERAGGADAPSDWRSPPP